MKKTFYILASLILGGFIVMFVVNVWQGIAYVQTHGRAGTLVIGERSGVAWAHPLPLKKIHTYSAVFAPNYQVVVQSDQELVEGREYPIRFLTRDKAQAAPMTLLRPIPGSVRLRNASDGAPASGQMLQSALAAAAGVPAGFVPFLLGETSDNALELFKRNSHPAEWFALILALLCFKVLVSRAQAHPWRVASPKPPQKDPVHPALRRIDPAPPAANDPR
jgi:hypothetical protein